MLHSRLFFSCFRPDSRGFRAPSARPPPRRAKGDFYSAIFAPILAAVPIRDNLEGRVTHQNTPNTKPGSTTGPLAGGMGKVRGAKALWTPSGYEGAGAS